MKLQNSKRQNARTPRHPNTQKQTRSKTPKLQNARSPKHPRHPRHQNAKPRKQEMSTPEHRNAENANARTPKNPEYKKQQKPQNARTPTHKKAPKTPELHQDRPQEKLNEYSERDNRTKSSARKEGKMDTKEKYMSSGHGKKT
ncbi:MAG: hypothetical protein L6R38_005396 [Xanthoria sp. 2 TBL-2021]|nr:MAG: hypothetical protein L6R38_005396 [Xanthoria sp. 2 TBL-2021]